MKKTEKTKKSTDLIQTIIILIFISIFSFYLGRFSVQYKNNINGKTITNKNSSEFPKLIKNKTKTIGVIASKKGNKYHLPWCPGATSMTQKNKIYFNSISEAEAAGYLPAKNCEGL